MFYNDPVLGPTLEISEEGLKRLMEKMRVTRSHPPVQARRTGISKDVVDAAREIVSTGRRVLALKRHSDVGGSDEEMRTLNAAAQWLTMLMNRGV